MKFVHPLSQDAHGLKTTAIPTQGVDDPTEPPVLSLVNNSSSTLKPQTHYVCYSWVSDYGETNVSPTVSINVVIGRDIKVVLPARPFYATKANIYISDQLTDPTLQGETITRDYTQSKIVTQGAKQPTDNTAARWITEVAIPNRASVTMATHSAVVVPANGIAESNWLRCEGYENMAITLTNDASTFSDIEVWWSHDGSTVHSKNPNLLISTDQDKSTQVSTKAVWGKVVLINEDDKEHVMSAWAYLKG